MINNQLTLSSEIKKSLCSVNYPFFIFGILLISTLGTLMVLGYHPENLSSGFVPLFGFTIKMAIGIGLLLIGSIVGMTVWYHFKPQVMKYVKAPEEIDGLKDGFITLGSYLATWDKTSNPREIGKIFYYIAKQLDLIPLIQSNIEKLKQDMAEMKTQFMREFQNQRKEIVEQRSAKEKAEKEALEERQKNKILSEQLSEKEKELESRPTIEDIKKLEFAIQVAFANIGDLQNQIKKITDGRDY